MAFATYSTNRNDVQQLEMSSQQDINPVLDIGYERLKTRGDSTIYADIDASKALNNRGLMDRHPRRIIVLAVVGCFLFCVIFGVIVYHMASNKDENSTHMDTKSCNHSPITLDHLTYINRRLHILQTMLRNHSDTLDPHADMNHQIDDIAAVLDKMQTNSSSISSYLREVIRRLDDMMNNLQNMVQSHSDTVRQELKRWLEGMLHDLNNMKGNSSDAIDQLTGMQLRMNGTAHLLQYVEDALRFSGSVSCMHCSDGWTQFRDSCYRFRDGNVTFRMAELRTCEDGWRHFGSSCYQFSHKNLSFAMAVEDCKGQDSYLVEVGTAAENNFLKQLLTDEMRIRWDVWMGMTDDEVEGVWKGVHSGNITQFTDWGPNEPNNARHLGGEHCASFGHHFPSKWQWNDLRCFWPMPFICETRSCSERTELQG